jgi:hypothetical protein
MATEKKTPAAAKAAPKKTPHILVDGKMKKVEPRSGKVDGRVHITNAQVNWIRTNARQLGGEWSQPKIAAKLGISQPTVSYIVRGMIRNG